MLKPNTKMFKGTFLLVVFCFIFCLSSCRVKRQDIQKSTVSTEAISTTKETYRDTILWAPKSETALTIPMSELTFKQGLNEVSKPKVFSQRTGNATAKVTVSPAGITVNTTCDSLAIAAKIKAEMQTTSFKKDADTDNTKEQTTGYSFLNLIYAFLIGCIVGSIVGWFISFNIKL
jgi:hypothetical protein